MADLNSHDLLLTGVPRGGTTLACQLLQGCHDTVALFEPIDVSRLPADRDTAVSEVLAFMVDARAQLHRNATAPSKQVDGAVPDNPFSSTIANGRRALLASPGMIRVQPPPARGFTLVVKHNAAFTALLPELSSRLRVLALVRHPLSVLASWNSVDLPVSHGRLPAGERFDPALARALEPQADLLTRQLLVLDWFYSRFERILPASSILRYEEVVESQGAVLRTSAGLEGGSVAGLSERNASALYSRAAIPALVDALVRKPGRWQHWYPVETIAPLAHRMLRAAHAGGAACR